MKNHTAWNLTDLRTLVLACANWIGIPAPPSTFVYARNSSSGHAWERGPIRIRVASPYPAPRRRMGYEVRDPNDLEAGLKIVTRIEAREPNVTEAGEMKPALFHTLTWVIEHEILHVAGWSHLRMRRERHPAAGYSRGFPEGLPKWAEGRRVRVAESRLSRKPSEKLAPEERTARRAAGAALAAEKRAARDVAALSRWERKLKLATTKVKALRRKVAARERRKS